MLTSPVRHRMDRIQVNLIQLKTFELKLDFAEYTVDLCWAPIYHLPGNFISATVGFVHINLQP